MIHFHNRLLASLCRRRKVGVWTWVKDSWWHCWSPRPPVSRPAPMNRNDASPAHCVRHFSCLLRHCVVPSADRHTQSLLSVFGVQLVPWWRAACERPLTASLRSMLQIGCVLKWKIDVGKRKIFTPQLLHWSFADDLKGSNGSCDIINAKDPFLCCLYMFTGGEDPSPPSSVRGSTWQEGSSAMWRVVQFQLSLL